ncbi:MAG: hypothetical protein AB4042_08405 [Leptolyngbyaceae cyanobacterium]
MTQLIISIVLTVPVALVLSRWLKGLLRIVTIALVTLTLVVVSANISMLFDAWSSLTSGLSLRNTPPVVDGAESSGTIPSTFPPERQSEPRVAPSFEMTDEAVSPNASPQSDSVFTGAIAVVSSQQDPNSAEFLAEFLSSSELPPDLNQADVLDSSPAEPTTSSQPINGLW